jgi:hypothetical protein
LRTGLFEEPLGWILAEAGVGSRGMVVACLLGVGGLTLARGLVTVCLGAGGVEKNGFGSLAA